MQSYGIYDREDKDRDESLVEDGFPTLDSAIDAAAEYVKIAGHCTIEDGDGNKVRAVRLVDGEVVGFTADEAFIGG